MLYFFLCMRECLTSISILATMIHTTLCFFLVQMLLLLNKTD
uniref:Uncharacterized protein n=1 Tax=Arundo donax TaxID=35708 RepID=A0A0A9HHW1_ARUDO